jgi:seryl-tRNA synthetase|tara:strand:- start:2857 stop:3264 length:408 start_codon:yes stop_codon:yes gene_type:complete
MDLDDNQIEKLMHTELKMREAIEELETKVKDIKAKRSQVQNALNEACQQLNVTSLKTPVGTLSRTLKTRYWTSDWPEMHKFLKANDVLELMEKRISQGNMKEFILNNPELSPPGLQATSEYTVSIRKNKQYKEKS